MEDFEIVAISDTHNKHKRLGIPESGDLIIHSGDCTSMGRPDEIKRFIRWYGDLDYEKIILVPGNHDFGFEQDIDTYRVLCERHNVTLLIDEAAEFRGVKIWGSPVQPAFCDWAFNRESSLSSVGCRKQYSPIKDHWDKIPEDTDILITHGPPSHILSWTMRGPDAGCPILLDRLENLNVKLHIFGHIHEARGAKALEIGGGKTVFVNASSLNLQYMPWGKHNYFKMKYSDIIQGIPPTCPVLDRQ